MFQRGQKIIILESSSPKRSHPAVGDIGYLNNMYLFFKARFILLDAFFLSYESDIRNNVDRCEKKRFLIDLGMKNGLKYKLREGGVPRKFFIANQQVANLTPHGYAFGQVDYMDSPSITSMWLRSYNNKGARLSSSNTKIPYGQIAIVPNLKTPINKEGKNALRCWIQCLLPILVAEVEMFMPSYSDIPTVYNIANAKHYNGLHKLIPKRRRKEMLTNKSVASVIEDMRIIQVMSKFFLDGCDRNFLKSEVLAEHRGIANAIWAAKEDIGSIIGKVPRATSEALIGIFFRSLLMSRNTKDALNKMKVSRVLPWSNYATDAIAKKLENIKQEANSDSAALNRIFEERLII